MFLKSVFETICDKETVLVKLVRYQRLWLMFSKRGETEQIADYKKELFADLQDISLNDAETVWQFLNSNPKAFLKAHTVSRIMARYLFDRENCP